MSSKFGFDHKEQLPGDSTEFIKRSLSLFVSDYRKIIEAILLDYIATYYGERFIKSYFTFVNQGLDSHYLFRVTNHEEKKRSVEARIKILGDMIVIQLVEMIPAKVDMIEVKPRDQLFRLFKDRIVLKDSHLVEGYYQDPMNRGENSGWFIGGNKGPKFRLVIV